MPQCIPIKHNNKGKKEKNNKKIISIKLKQKEMIDGLVGVLKGL
jgi:hypothetical protein